MSMMAARDIMTEDVLTIGPNSTIDEAIQILLREKISGLPVVDNEDRLIGIVTEFAMLAIAYSNEVLNDKVMKHMSTEVISVAPDDPISKVADLCIVHRVRRVPVVDHGRIIGLIARRDVLKGLLKAKHHCAAEA